MKGPEKITFPRIYDPRGNLSFAQNGDQVPFNIKRVFWIYDVPSGEERGGHAHKQLIQVIVAANGSFDVNISNGEKTKSFTLNRPFEGLLVPPGYWSSIDNFSSGSVCMVLTSAEFDEEDYIRHFDDYKVYVSQNGVLPL